MGTQGGELSFGFQGQVVVEIIGNHETQHGVAKEFESFVVTRGDLAIFVVERTVNEREDKQFFVFKGIAYLFLDFPWIFQQIMHETIIPYLTFAVTVV